MADHTEDNQLKEPLPSQIMTGYMMSKARQKSLKYYNQALTCLEQAKEDTNESLGDDSVQNVDLGDIRSAIHDALAAIERVESAHLSLSIKYQELGYRKLTSDDFLKFGATGR